MSNEKAHAVYSASGAERWLNCPGSIKLAAKYPPLPESDYAAEGTLAHSCLENVLQIWLYGLDLYTEAFSFEMVAHANDVLQYVKSRVRELDGCKVFLESKVNASTFITDGQFGTLDIALVKPGQTLEVIDYKYGAGIPVDVVGKDGELNPQLAYYALAMSYRYAHDFETVRLTVIQPRADHAGGDTTRSVDVSIDKLVAMARVFKRGYKATLAPDAPLKGGKWCRFCPAAIECPETKTRPLLDAGIGYTDEDGITLLPEIATVKNLGRILDACNQLNTWVSRVRGFAYQVLERGGKIDGWKLVEKRAVRKWANEAVAAVEAFDEFGKEAFKPAELLSPYQLEKKYRKRGKTWVDKRTIRIQAGYTLAKDDDPRDRFAGFKNQFKAIE